MWAVYCRRRLLHYLFETYYHLAFLSDALQEAKKLPGRFTELTRAFIRVANKHKLFDNYRV